MKRRWFIRSVALLLVVTFSTVWVRSFHQVTYVYNVTQYSRTYLWSQQGKLYISYAGLEAHTTTFSPTMGILDNPIAKAYVIGLPLFVHHTFGFIYSSNDAVATNLRNTVIAVPWWFLDSAAILIGIYVWHKTRPKANPAAAFPVEIKP